MRCIAPITALLSLALLSGCGCGSNAEAVSLAQTLSASRLARLASDLSALRREDSDRRKTFDNRTGIPVAFQDLHPKAIVIDSSMASVYLSGCVDDKVIIVLLGDENKGHELVLLKGEQKGKTVLWHSQ